MENYVDDDVDTIYSEIKESMKNIVSQTNSILKFSSSAFKKAKEKSIVLENEIMKPKEPIKQWLQEKNKSSITLPEFFDLVFQNAKNSNLIDYKMRTITFLEKDAHHFGFTPNVPIHILTIFEMLPTYFE